MSRILRDLRPDLHYTVARWNLNWTKIQYLTTLMPLQQNLLRSKRLRDRRHYLPT